MNKLIGIMVASLVIGACGMWAATHLKVSVETGTPPPPTTVAPPPPVYIALPPPPSAEPAPLPASITKTSPANTNIVQASATLVQDTPITKNEKIVSVSDGVVTWDSPKSDSDDIKLVGNDITLKFPDLATAKVLSIKIDNKDLSGADKYDAAKAELPLTLTDDFAKPGVVATLQIVRTVTTKDAMMKDVVTNYPSTIKLTRPLAGDTAFVYVSSSSTPKLDFSNSAEAVGTYLQLKGRTSGGVRTATFWVLDTAKKKVSEQRVVVKTFNTLTDTWDCEVKLPELPAGQITLLARGEFANGHLYTASPITINVVAKPDSLAKPTLSVAKASAPNSALTVTDKERLKISGLPTILSNTRALTVTVAADANAKAVFLKQDSSLEVVKARAATNTFDIASVGEGRDHIFTATSAAGETNSPAATIAVRVVTVGPSVVSATSPGFGQSNGNGEEKITIQFSSDNLLSEATVIKTNFDVILRTPAGASAASSIVTDAYLDPSSNIVTLVVSGVIPGSYTLKIKDGIEDVYGNKIVKVPGAAAGYAYETTLFTQQVTSLPSVASGVSLQSGQPVEMPEVLRPRILPDGFNPSDRVETRVIRLYYYRDAHRVAQIVNRDVKSYNAASVDVRRRAADRTRDDANKLTDDRKQQEALAVQAAQAARAAETKLRDLQNRQAQARTEAATAKSQASQRQQQLDDAIRNLGRAQTNINTSKAVDPSTDAANRRVTEINNEIAQLKGIISLASYPDIPTLAKIDDEVVAAEQALNDAQTKFTVEDVKMKKYYETQDDVKTAKQKVLTAQDKLAIPGKTPEAIEQNKADLAKAIVDYDLAVQVAIAGAPSNKEYDDARKALQTKRVDLSKKQSAQNAVKELTKKNIELTDAQNTVKRLGIAADARGANDPGADPSQDLVKGLQAEIAKLNTAAANAASKEQALQTEIATTQAEVQAKRAVEIEATQKARQLDQQELRGRESQFRNEVAAAKEDPDTYAPGLPDSVDPVRQCSISVIGEGLIQIRGPIKGLNTIRTMINQIDIPSGQVRVGVHTIQVNGERAERMDRVVQNIQRYLDHSRFLTVQSSQMLRKAVTTVAARKADEVAMTLPPGCTQADRDQKYLHCFFGKDFIDELAAMDSEFLKTGNKILSLHSMDSTSLSSAMLLMALAKNNIRAEIINEFQCQLQTKLPQAEWNFYAAGLTCPTRCEAHFDRKFCVLAGNARFESLFGYFNAEVQGDDTLNPLQREFVRLAQIFKSRMITEMELKQRVMERSILEDRVGDYITELRKAKKREDAAREEQLKLQVQVTKTSSQAQLALSQLEGPTQLILQLKSRFESELLDLNMLKVVSIEDINAGTMTAIDKGNGSLLQNSPQIRQWDLKTVSDDDLVYFRNAPEAQKVLANINTFLGYFNYLGAGNDAAVKHISSLITKATTGPVEKQYVSRKQYLELTHGIKAIQTLIGNESRAAHNTLQQLTTQLNSTNPNYFEIIGNYRTLQYEYLSKLKDTNDAGSLRPRIAEAFSQGEKAFVELGNAAAAAQAAAQNAKLTRRQLDEKKLLDMLVDELEDKFIELVDGTRAHTANVDNYLKGLATALDDDFNTQFYQPAFSKIRLLGAGWDVQLGQIESTSVLTNNRMLAKVSPAASMEFDLPQRSIFIKEAFKGAKAAVDEYGALLNDPTFLSAAKMFSGVPPATGFGMPGGLPAVRNVLPGLPSSADELLMSQAGGNRKEFGSALEALIPDPAVYKFETGTGYEIRPVMNPDGQSVVFGFDYMYTSDVREPVRADEKHLGKVKRHFVHTDVQLSNYEMREVSKYWVGLKASRTSQGVQLLQDIPGVGVLFRPAPSAQSSLQQNIIYAQTTLFPTLFDLMGLRYAPAVADVDSQFMKTEEFVVRGRRDFLRAHIFDYGASRVDDALRIMYGERRPDLYRTQYTIPWVHPNGYQGSGLRLRDSQLEENYSPLQTYPPSHYYPGRHPGAGTGAGGASGVPSFQGVPNGYPTGSSGYPTEAGGYGVPLTEQGAKIPPPAGVPGAPVSMTKSPVQGTTLSMPKPIGTTITPATPPTAVPSFAPQSLTPPSLATPSFAAPIYPKAATSQTSPLLR